MGMHVLVPVDGSSPSRSALDHAIEQYDLDRLTLLHVVDPAEGVYTSPGDGYYDAQAYERAVEHGEALIERARERVDDADSASSVSVETVVETGRPARTIVDYAGDHGIDGIVVGSHGRTGVSRVLLGSVAETVVRRSPVPVTVVR